MKVKQQPSDFRVEELTTVNPGSVGDYAVYRLDKVGRTTPDAIQIIRQRWGLDWRRLSYGGLKDRHAETSQYFSVLRGPHRNLSQQGIAVTYLGRMAEPYESHHIRANRFTIIIRHLIEEQESLALRAVREVSGVGLPNYFDDQRFGSVGHDKEFVAREMVRGRFEEALKLALVAPYEHDRSSQKREKATLQRLWGDWSACRDALSRGPVRFLIEYLAAHPTDFRGAVARLRPELGGLYLAAYQSFLWNRMLDQWLRKTVPTEGLEAVPLQLGNFAVPVRLDDRLHQRWESLVLPLPSARQKPEPGAEWYEVAETVLAEEGLTLATLKVPGLNKPFFSKGDRVACVRPEGVQASAEADELNRNRRKLQLSFDLPRGSYATMFVKRITAMQSICPPPGP